MEQMKKWKTKHFVLAGVVLAVIIAAVLLCLLWPKGQGEGNNSEIEGTETSSEVYIEVTSQMKEAVEDELIILKLALASEEQTEYLKKMNERRSYELVSAKEVGELTYVTLRFSVPDLYAIVNSMEVNEDWTEEQMDEAFSKAVTDAALVELEADVLLYEEDGEMQIEITRDFLDAYYGGIMRIQEEYYEEIFGGTSDEE